MDTVPNTHADVECNHPTYYKKTAYTQLLNNVHKIFLDFESISKSA